MVEKCSLSLSDRLLAEAKALVDDRAAFTREMTRILREKQSHPLIAQMMKPAESSDPPPTTAADSSSGAEPYTVNPYSFSELLGLTWGIHGWNTSMTVILKFCPP